MVSAARRSKRFCEVEAHNLLAMYVVYVADYDSRKISGWIAVRQVRLRVSAQQKDVDADGVLKPINRRKKREWEDGGCSHQGTTWLHPRVSIQVQVIYVESKTELLSAGNIAHSAFVCFSR